ncbi:MAG: dihydroorotase [Streptococcaceae bacterium]|jgi:dihydroorotase|nr:dihydroorotase [Streptococcaceae bacterium]
MTKTIITKARRIVRDNQLEPIMVVIEDGKIVAMNSGIIDEEGEVLDAHGALVMPGLVDVHTHLREPGFEAKETIVTGTKAAAHGGYTTICAMPTLNPVPDTPEHLKVEQDIIEKDAVVKVLPYASITQNRMTEDLVELSLLAKSGAFAFSNDGNGVQTEDTMRQAMTEATKLHKAIVAHAENKNLMAGGVIREGKFGLPEWKPETEYEQVARDLKLAKETGVHYHICHISTKETVDLVRKAKANGVHVTAEVAPHHLLLAVKDIPEDNALYKMNPPLPTQVDQEALLTGLLDGTIDMIATDQAPHTTAEKSGSFREGAFGIVNIEQAFALLYTKFVQTGIFTLEQLQKWMSTAPVKAFNITNAGQLHIGDPADLVLFDLKKEFSVDPKDFLSKGTNTPFIGWELYGETRLTMVDGKIVYRKEL